MLDKAPDLAKEMKVSVWQVYDLTAKGKIPGVVRLGPRTIRYIHEVWQPWVAEGCPPLGNDDEQTGAAAHG